MYCVCECILCTVCTVFTIIHTYLYMYMYIVYVNVFSMECVPSVPVSFHSLIQHLVPFLDLDLTGE